MDNMSLPKILKGAPEQLKQAYITSYLKLRKIHYKAGAIKMCKELAMKEVQAQGWVRDVGGVWSPVPPVARS